MFIFYVCLMFIFKLFRKEFSDDMIKKMLLTLMLY